MVRHLAKRSGVSIICSITTTVEKWKQFGVSNLQRIFPGIKVLVWNWLGGRTLNTDPHVQELIINWDMIITP
ncbi:hypothetical protein AQUCO_02400019v1 [Aquilegia coerulea]|uniref:Uncharacterized protein n=1 Tax=Aquilegia coerulea TaxID=218851 RepID=A0A2G5DAY7_AQUCA|nr:hypothetical protein AQUCO_02400019v1 [Aquilegia coerulea]